MLLTKCKDRTDRMLAQGIDRTDQAQRGPYKKRRSRYFP